MKFQAIANVWKIQGGKNMTSVLRRTTHDPKPKASVYFLSSKRKRISPENKVDSRRLLALTMPSQSGIYTQDKNGRRQRQK